MSRHENEDISNINQPISEIEEIYYHNTGIQSNIPLQNAIVCAKEIVNKTDKTHRCFVLLDGGELYDPSAISVRYNRKNWKLRLVTEQVFNMYVAFLGFREKGAKSRQSIKIKAERLI